MTLSKVNERISKHESEWGRDAGSVVLIAVSKVQPVEKIEKVLKAGHKDFGENRVQEALAKWPKLKGKYPKINLHLLGPLQTNKIDQALSVFDVIHSLDREKLAAKLASGIQKIGKDVEMFIQVNFENEIQKAGISVENLDDFVKICTKKYDLNISGLMCIPPINKDPEKFFLELKILAERNGLTKLSMGMSSDYAEAIRCGSTHVRVGTAIFGSREKI